MGKKYYSIGEIAKLANTSVKKMRYYDDIGVLIPAMIDPVTGYRYYVYPQLQELNLIQFCIAMEVPLKMYKKYLHNDELNYKDFLTYCKQKATEKLLKAQRNMAYITSETDSMELLYRHGLDRVYERLCPQRYFIVSPFEGAYGTEDFMKELKKLQQKIHVNDWIDFFECGILHHWNHSICTRYIYCEIYTTKGLDDTCSVLTIPADTYLSVLVSSDKIKDYETYFNPINDDSFLIIEYEQCTAHMTLTDSVLEIQYIKWECQ